METHGPLKISKQAAIYTSCYCEENVWKLCEWVKDNQPELIGNCFAVFISNGSEKVPLWFQRAGDEDSQGFVIWDYHVIFVYADDANNSDEISKNPLVYDLDTLLSFPVSLIDYINYAIREEENLLPQFHRYFRVIPASQYLTSFSSDRSRMKKPDGSWIKDPPPYPPIKTANCNDNLNSFISMDQDECDAGKVVNLNTLKKQFLS